jgi:hypothetical protein
MGSYGEPPNSRPDAALAANAAITPPTHTPASVSVTAAGDPHLQHAAAAGAERHANPDFVTPLAHVVRQDAIDANCWMQQGEAAKRHHQPHRNTPLAQRITETILERADVEHGQLRIDRAHGVVARVSLHR